MTKLPAILFTVCLPGMAAIAIQDVTVIDVTAAAARPHLTVVIDKDRILSVGKTVPAGARIVSGTGKFLIPGLWDMNVHLWYKENQLPMFVAYGVTGIADRGSDFERVSDWRAAIETGKAVGPHIITSGPAVTDRSPDDDKLPVILAHTPDEARQAFDRLWNMDVDFIELLPGLSRDSYFALAEQARHWHMRLEGPVPTSITAWEAIDARQRDLEQMSGVMKSVGTDEDAIRFFEKCELTGTRISPALVMWQRMAHTADERLRNDPRLKYVPESIRKSWPELKDDANAESKSQIEGIYRLVELSTHTKVEVLAGTGTGEPWTIPGATLHDELEQLVAAGMAPHQALRAATLAPARFLEWDEEMGTIEKGKVADLVLLYANPLEDIRNTRRIAAVFARGKYYSRQSLDAMLSGTSPARELVPRKQSR